MTGAWDLACAWLREEPFEHHVACPFQVPLALLTVSVLIALRWGGICRIGEVLAAFRKDLVLPSDVLFTSASVLLKVQEPKTRFRAASHQVAKIEYGDLVELIGYAFEKLQPETKLLGRSFSRLIQN